jgi:hypothetical protein
MAWSSRLCGSDVGRACRLQWRVRCGFAPHSVSIHKTSQYQDSSIFKYKDKRNQFIVLRVQCRKKARRYGGLKNNRKT